MNINDLIDNELYYVEDTSRLVGNTKSWWYIDDCGYTTDVRTAKHWTGAHLKKKFAHLRDIDLVAWLKTYIDEHIEHAVSNACIDYGNGINLKDTTPL